MLTCFKENTVALQFYQSLGYGIDLNSPSLVGVMVDYEILSRRVSQKESTEAKNLC
jgi:hypothetical protein